MIPGTPPASEDDRGTKVVARVVVGVDDKETVPAASVPVVPTPDNTVAVGFGTVTVDVVLTVNVLHLVVVVVEVEVELMVGL